MTDTRAARPAVTFVFILTLRVLSSAQHVKDRSVTCDVPWVEPFAVTSITCHFPENVSQTRRNVTVSFYKGMNLRDADNILNCWWLSGEMSCTVQSGYSFNRLISHELTLGIPRVSANYIGRYTCKLSNTNPNDITPCEFRIKLVGKTMCDVPSVPLNSRTSLTCYFPEDLSKTSADFSVRRYSSSSEKDVLVSCEWKEDHRVCKTRRGYEFDFTVTTYLTVRIPNVQQDQEGTYSCHFTSALPVRIDTCSLTIGKDVDDINLTRTIVISVTSTVLFFVLIILVCKCIRRSISNYETIKESPSEPKPAKSRSMSDITKIKIYAEEEHKFWQEWVEAVFPDLDSSFYFLPPVHVNHVPITRKTIAGQDVWVLQSAPRQTDESIFTATIEADDSNVRHVAAMQRFLVCLQTMCQQNKEVLVGLSQLPFKNYLSASRYAAAARKLPLPSTLPPDLPRECKQGDFRVLIIHRHYGFVTCQVKAFDGNVNKQNIPQYKISEETNKEIRRNLEEAISQLQKAETMLSHLVSDIAPGLRIIKTIVLPYLTVSQVQQALDEDPNLTKDLHQCLETINPADITGMCLFSNQLSDPKTPWYVSSHSLQELGHWWQRRVAAAGPARHMTSELYKILVARFCGPATSVTVPCTCPPRVSVKTLGQAVWCTGECYTAVITLFPEQLHLLNTQPPTVFVTGPPGTGKTVVLLMMGIKWLRCGHHVYIVSTWDESRAACIMLYHLLLQTVNTQQSAGVSPGQPHLLEYRLNGDEEVDKAVNDISRKAGSRTLYVIADEVTSHLQTLFDKLIPHVPRLHLWAASCFHEIAPAGWQVEYFTRPLRSPPVVVREVEQDRYITIGLVKSYSKRGVSDHTDGPPVRRLYHRGHGHSGDRPADCVTCGRDVASFLHSLRVGVTENVTTNSIPVPSVSSVTTPPCLQWRDMLMLDWRDVSENSGMVKALKEAGIPVRVMKDDEIKDVATACSDVLWVANGTRTRGLERKVVVCLDAPNIVNVRLLYMSRCTSQLVVIFHDY